MNKYFKIFLIFSLVFLFSHQASAAGLVPCGTSAAGSSPCTPCHLWTLANNVVDFIFKGLAIPILTVVMIWGGVLMLANFGNPTQITKGRKMLLSGVIGIFIAAGAWLIVTTIVNTFASGKYTVGWANIECDLDSGGGGGITPTPTPGPGTPTPTPTPATALQCSASSVSPLVTSIVNCVLADAPKTPNNLSVPAPQPNQLNAGDHACNLTGNPPNISCHYGGRLCNGTGNAVDFSLPASQRSPLNWGKLRDLALTCASRNGGSGGAYCEAGGVRPQAGCSASGIDHVHVNASASCGCQ